MRAGPVTKQFLVAAGRALCWVVTAGVIARSPAAAQEASLRGTVRGHTGEPLPGVHVTATPGGADTTDEFGRFSLPIGPTVPVVLLVEHASYRAERVTLSPLRPGEVGEIALTLLPVYALDAITVTTTRERPLLNAEDATIGGSVERPELESLPSDARNPLSMAFQIPGVAQSTGFFGDAPPLTILGGNSLYTQYTLDGLDNNEGFLGGPRVELPLSGLSRVSVLAASYPAAFGRSSNGVVVAESQSGADRWSGEAFLFHRPGLPLDASPRFAPAGVDPEGFERVQVGGTLGGPIRLGQTFAFATAEYSNEREDRIGSTARASFIGSEIRETWKLFGRLDHGWSTAHTSTLRFALSDVSRAGQGGGVIVPEADITTRRIGSLLNLTHSSALAGGNGSNIFSAQLGTFRWFFPPTASSLSIPQVTIVSPDLTTVEAVIGSSNFVFDEAEVQLQLREALEVRLGSIHTLRVGTDVVSSSFVLDAGSTNPLGAYTVINDGNIPSSGRLPTLADVPADVRVLRYTIDARPQEVDLTQTLWGAFIEDRIRISPALSLTVGLRWDYDDITSRGESDPDLNNFQPRVSFNWLATGSSVFRGGSGIYTGKLPYAVYSDAVQFGEEGNAVLTFEGGAFPAPALFEGDTPEELDPATRAFPPREIRRLFARGLDQPHSIQTTLGYQREARDLWGFSIDGIWVETRNLPRSWDLNPLERELTPADTINRTAAYGDPLRPILPAPNSFRRLTTTDTGGRGRYLALQLNGRRKLSREVTLEGTYVLSRAQNDTEDINFNATIGNDFAAEWADAINDRRHRLTLRSTFQPVERLQIGALADLQTGTPFNRIAYFRDLDGSGEIYGNGFIGNHDRFRGVGRNAERLPSSFLLNLSGSYRIPATPGSLEARVEVFNAFNSMLVSGFANGIPGGGPRTQLGRPGDPVSYSSSAPPRQFQLSVRWLW